MAVVDAMSCWEQNNLVGRGLQGDLPWLYCRPSPSQKSGRGTDVCRQWSAFWGALWLPRVAPALKGSDQKLQRLSPLLFPGSTSQGSKADRDACPHTAFLWGICACSLLPVQPLISLQEGFLRPFPFSQASSKRAQGREGGFLLAPFDPVKFPANCAVFFPVLVA